MGSPITEAGRNADETQHQVTLTRGFWMQITEVTQARWQARMGNNPSAFTGNSSSPVDRISWFDAVAYANALSAAEGLPAAYDLSSCSGTPGAGTYVCSTVTITATSPYAAQGWRLPTEAEWEYAYRAGTTTTWYFGVDGSVLGTYGWVSSNAGAQTRPVGQKVPNGWGLHDMIGNVWEWCWDWYASVSGSAVDPVGPSSGSNRFIRGGSWYDAQAGTRAALRNHIQPGTRYTNIGFRLVRTRP